MSLFVGNISRNVRARDLEDEFTRFGKCQINHKVTTIELSTNREATHLWITTTKKRRRMPWVIFKTKIWAA